MPRIPARITAPSESDTVLALGSIRQSVFLELERCRFGPPSFCSGGGWIEPAEGCFGKIGNAGFRGEYEKSRGSGWSELQLPRLVGRDNTEADTNRVWRR